MSIKIYVGNLPFSTTGDDLADMFQEYGPITSADVISDRDTGRSRGFGFVEMENEPDGRKAIEELDGAEVDGRVLTVNEARQRKPDDRFRR
jgi:RNA recognition motif-containing protein